MYTEYRAPYRYLDIGAVFVLISVEYSVSANCKMCKNVFTYRTLNSFVRFLLQVLHQCTESVINELYYTLFHIPTFIYCRKCIHALFTFNAQSTLVKRTLYIYKEYGSKCTARKKTNTVMSVVESK